MNRYLLAFLLLTTSCMSVHGQIEVTPAMPTDLDSVSLIFNASQGSGGLAGYTGEVYAHTGVITNLSSGSGDWKYVKAGWGVNIPDCKLVSLGNNLWSLKIGPDIRQYYGVPAGENILQMAFVFRSGVQVGGVWLEGKTSSGGDIFWDVFPSGLSVSISQPAENIVIVPLNQVSAITVTSHLADSTFLYAGTQLLASGTGNTLTFNHTASQYGAYWIKAVAKNDTAVVADSLFYFVRQPVNIASLPAGMTEGINYLSDTSVVLCLYAPLKEFVFVIGDFNNWMPDQDYYMNRTADGKRFWVQIDGLVPGQEYIYQYFVDAGTRIGDPYARKVSDPWSDQYITNITYPGILPYPADKTKGMATVLQTAQTAYTWQSGPFTPPANTDLIVYELLIRDFTEEHTFQSVIDTLGYLKKLGINAIELMPVSEFEGNISWGYNPDYYFAVDKYYGHENILKSLIDTCHKLGIAVISDIVLNHAFGSSPYVMLYWDYALNRPAANSPFYNPVAKHDYNVGYDMNHSTPDSRYYTSKILRFWLEEYRFDGFRFDLSKGFTQNNTLGNVSAWGAYDASRIAILSTYFDTIKAVKADAKLILEHFADNTEEKELSNRGMLLWGNSNYNYHFAGCGFTTGSNSDFSWVSHKTRGWTNPNLVGYMESHDEERQMVYCLTSGNISGNYNIRDTVTALERMALNAAFFLTIPGPKMIWQFGERGFDYSINWPCMTDNCRLDPKPPRWDYLDNYRRKLLYFYYSSLLKLRAENQVFQTTDFELDLSGTYKKIRLNSPGLSVVILGNFGVVQGNIIPKFYSTGTWYDYFGGDSLLVTNINGLINLKPGEFRVYTSSKLATPIGLEENAPMDNRLQVYPNPAFQDFHVIVNQSKPEYCQIVICDFSGAIVGELFNGIFQGTKQLNFSPEAAGMYFVRYSNGKEIVTRKIIVQK